MLIVVTVISSKLIFFFLPSSPLTRSTQEKEKKGKRIQNGSMILSQGFPLGTKHLFFPTGKHLSIKMCRRGPRSCWDPNQWWFCLKLNDTWCSRTESPISCSEQNTHFLLTQTQHGNTHLLEGFAALCLPHFTSPALGAFAPTLSLVGPRLNSYLGVNIFLEVNDLDGALSLVSEGDQSLLYPDPGQYILLLIIKPFCLLMFLIPCIQGARIMVTLVLCCLSWLTHLHSWSVFIFLASILSLGCLSATVNMWSLLE